MEKWISDSINDIYKYIREEAFNSSNELKRNLKVFKYNSELEWFNCCLIAKQKKDLFAVNTMKRWESLVGEKDLKLKESSSFLQLLKPSFNQEKNNLDFIPLDTCFLSDIENEYLVYTKSTSIMETIYKYDSYEEYLKLLKEDWQTTYLECYLKLFDFYYVANEELKDFYMQALRYTFSEQLDMKRNEDLFVLDENPIDKLYIYRNIHNLIVSFHIVYKAYLERLSDIYLVILNMDLDKSKMYLDKEKISEKVERFTQDIAIMQEQAQSNEENQDIEQNGEGD